MTRYCRACAAETVEDAAYCHRCGRPLGNAPERSDGVNRTGDASTAGDTAATPVAGGRSADAPKDEERERQPVSGSAPTPQRSEQEALSEQTLWSGSYSHRAILPAWILVVLLTLAAGASSLPFVGLPKSLFITLVSAVVSLGGVGLYLAYRRLSVHYELTNLRFVCQTGLLTRHTDRMDVMDIDDVAFDQGPVERWLGVGTIKLMSRDASHPELLLPGIGNVEDAAETINSAVRAERRRRGLFIEVMQ